MDLETYEPLIGREQKPLLLVDVDGVLSIFGFNPTSPPPGRGALVDGIPHLLSVDAADLLTALSGTFECVWCTGWEERAEEHLPHLLGLPGGWPHLTFQRNVGPGASTSGHWKLEAIDAFAGPDRPLAWIDDAHDDACRTWAAGRPGPTLLVVTNPAVGLTRAHARELLDWSEGVRPQNDEGRHMGAPRNQSGR
jgi:hypothetical protein